MTMSNVTVHSSLVSTVRVHVDMSGNEGRPVVLIHGWPLSGVSFQDQVAPLVDAGLRTIRYDRRGFGHSDKPNSGYDYDTLADDLAALITEFDLHDVSLVGFSMGGGEVARYVSRHGEDRLHSVVFAAAVTPYLAQTSDNPEGPLTSAQADEFAAALTDDRDAFFEEFTGNFFSANGELMVSEQDRQDAVALAQQSDQQLLWPAWNHGPPPTSVPTSPRSPSPRW